MTDSRIKKTRAALFLGLALVSGGTNPAGAAPASKAVAKASLPGGILICRPASNVAASYRALTGIWHGSFHFGPRRRPIAIAISKITRSLATATFAWSRFNQGKHRAGGYIRVVGRPVNGKLRFRWAGPKKGDYFAMELSKAGDNRIKVSWTHVTGDKRKITGTMERRSMGAQQFCPTIEGLAYSWDAPRVPLRFRKPAEPGGRTGSWSGVWDGRLEHVLVIRSNGGAAAKVIYAWGISKELKVAEPGYLRLRGRMGANGLRLRLPNDATVNYTFLQDGTIAAAYKHKGKTSRALLLPVR